MTCRHRNSWLLGEHLEWCNDCGAFRRLWPCGDNASRVVSPWCRPKESYGAWTRRRTAYAQRYLTDVSEGAK